MSLDYTGKTCLVTGANAGIGRAMVLHLAKHNAARIVLACRNLEKANEAAEAVRAAIPAANVNTEVDVRHLDLASLESVKKLAREWEEESKNREDGGRLDLLFCNAGLVVPNANPGETEDGFETTYQANALSHFLLITLLLRYLALSYSPRVISTSATGHTLTSLDPSSINHSKRTPTRDAWPVKGWNVNFFQMYCDSKILVNMINRELQNRLRSHPNPAYRKIRILAYHPGFVSGDMTNKASYGIPRLVTYPATVLARMTALTPEQGADTGLWLGAASEEEVGEGGSYWAKRKKARLNRQVEDEGLRKLYWDRMVKDAGIPQDAF